MDEAPLITLATVGDLASLYRLPRATVASWRSRGRQFITAEVNVSRTDIYVLERIAPEIASRLRHLLDPERLAEHRYRACVPSGSVVIGLQGVSALVHTPIDTVRRWSSNRGAAGELPEPAVLLGGAGAMLGDPYFTTAQFEDWPGYDPDVAAALAETNTVQARAFDLRKLTAPAPRA